MPMQIRCPNCGTVLSVPDNAAGKTLRCPTCNHVFSAPLPLTAATPKNTAPVDEKKSPASVTAAPKQTPAKAKKPEVPRVSGEKTKNKMSPHAKRGKGIVILMGLAVAFMFMSILCVAGIGGAFFWMGKRNADLPLNANKADADKPIVIAAPKLDQDTVNYDLGDTLDRVCVGGGGRYILMHYVQAKRIALFDVSEAKVVHQFPVSGKNVRFAAGREKLVMLFTEDDRVERWDLASRRKEKDHRLQLDGNGIIKDVAMGSASSGPLIVGRPAELPLAFQFDLFDLDTFAPIKRNINSGWENAQDVHFRAAPEGNVFGAWNGGLNPSGLRTFVIDSDKIGTKYEHKHTQQVVPGPRGDFFFTGIGIFTSELKPAGKNKDNNPWDSTICIPAHNSEYYLAIDWRGQNAKSIEICLPGDERPVATLPDVQFAATTVPRNSDSVRRDQRYIFVPEAKVLITIPQTDHKLVIHRLDVDDLLQKSGVDYLFVTSRPKLTATRGEEYAYKLAVKSKHGGLSYKLLESPDGMRINEVGQLKWTVPNGLGNGEHRVVISVRDAKNLEILHAYKIGVGVPGSLMFNEAPKVIDAKDKSDDGKKGPPIVKAKLPPLPPPQAIESPKFSEDFIRVNLGGKIRDVAVGGSGRFLLLHHGQERKVALFDVNQAAVVHHFPLDHDNARIAASNSKLVVVYPDTKLIQRWDLLTRAKEVTTTIPLVNDIGQILVGSASDGPVVVASNKSVRDGGTSVFLDLQTFRPMDFAASGPVLLDFCGHEARVAPDGRVYTMWGKMRRTAKQILHLKDDGTKTAFYQGQGVDHLIPGPNSSLIFSRDGVFGKDFKPVDFLDFEFRKSQIPSVHDEAYGIAYKYPGGDFGKKRNDKFQLKVHRRGAADSPRDVKDVDLGPWEDKQGAAPDQEELPLDKRIFLIPRANVLVTIPTPNNQLVVRRFIWDAPAKEKEKVILVATPLPLRNEKAFVTAQIAEKGPLFRVSLVESKTYNVFVKGNDFSPAVQIQDGVTVLVAKRAALNENQVLMSFTAKRTDEFYVRVDPQGLGVKSDFQLTIAATTAKPPQILDLTTMPSINLPTEFHVEDPINPGDFGPHREYLLKLQAGKEYSIKVLDADQPVGFRVFDKGTLLLEAPKDGKVGSIVETFKAPQTGEYRLRIFGRSAGLAGYRLEVNRSNNAVAADDGQPRKVVFDADGRFRLIDKLAVTDPRDNEISKGRFKTYLLPLEADKHYVIEQRSQELDCHLTLFDPKGQRIATDDNGAGGRDARLLVKAAETGVYRLHASSAKDEAGEFAMRIWLNSGPFSVPTNEALQTEKAQAGDASVIVYKPAKALGAFTPVWMPDGKAFCQLGRDGYLRRIRVPDFVEEKKLLVDKANYSGLELTSAGIVLHVWSKGEFWLVDPQELSVIHRQPCSTFPQFPVTCPTQPYYFLGAVEKGRGIGSHRFDLRDPWMPPLLFTSPNFIKKLELSPDGRFVIGDGGGKLTRWRIEQPELVVDENGAPFSSNWLSPQLLISPDQKYVLRLHDAKANRADAAQLAPPSGFGVIAYAFTDLKKPAFFIDTESKTYDVQADPKTGHFYAHSKSRGLIVADSEGKHVREIKLPISDTGPARACLLAVHPEGGKLLASFQGSQTTVMYIELAAPKKIDVKKDGPRAVSFNADGVYRNDDRVTTADPRGKSGHYKSYQTPLEAGYNYTFEIVSNEIAGDLTLFDPSGKQIAHDVEGSRELTARILFEATSSGEYRLQASHRKNTVGAFTLVATRFKLPVPMALNKALQVENRKPAGCKSSAADLGAGPLHPASVVWSRDGKAILVLQDGALRRIRVPDFVEESRLTLGADAHQLRLCALGLLVTRPEMREMWLIDPEQLKIRHRLMFFEGPADLITGPNLTYAFSHREVTMTGKELKLPTVDKLKVTRVRSYDLSQQQAAFSDTLINSGSQIIALASDGKLAVGRNAHAAFRVKVDGLKIGELEYAMQFIDGNKRSFVSDDGQLFLRPITKDSKASGKLFGSINGFAVYRVSNLEKAAFTIDTASRAVAAAFDPKSGNIYTHSAAKGLIVVDANGNRIRDFPIEFAGTDEPTVWHMVADPQGSRVLLFTGVTSSAKVLHVELPADLKMKKTSLDSPMPHLTEVSRQLVWNTERR
jgi:predicted Zn finger-like uncharacterized protein